MHLLLELSPKREHYSFFWRVVTKAKFTLNQNKDRGKLLLCLEKALALGL